MIQSLQATSRADTPPPKTSTVTCVTRQPQRQFPASPLPSRGTLDITPTRRSCSHQVLVRIAPPRRETGSTHGSICRCLCPSRLINVDINWPNKLSPILGWFLTIVPCFPVGSRGRELSLRLPSYTSNGRCLWWRGISPGRGLKRLDHVIQLVQTLVQGTVLLYHLHGFMGWRGGDPN